MRPSSRRHTLLQSHLDTRRSTTPDAVRILDYDAHDLACCAAQVERANAALLHNVGQPDAGSGGCQVVDVDQYRKAGVDGIDILLRDPKTDVQAAECPLGGQ